MREKRPLISASEVGDYVYCALAWRLRAEGQDPTALRAAREAGIKWHHTHGRGVIRARRLQIAAMAFVAMAIFLALLLVLYLVLH